ncbi:hypothetical protein INT48_003744 [Thamnidium elegans]|uniref:C3H1-type domain-containing protein n=1 Tax=Thamnidium elegans TaxID=101142 RepID=A0A8H7SP74_9FUNG|nr:hypothetical protein INT48_003744 [Thamnidium elegans]
MVLKMNQQRFLTIAGSASLVAIAAFGIWKWSKHAPEKKTTRKDRQVDKDSKQSHSSVSAKETIKKPESIIKGNEATEKVLVEKVFAEKAPTEKVVELKAPQPTIIKTEEPTTNKVEQVTEAEQKVETTKVESSQELMMETILVEEDKQAKIVVEEEEYVMVGKAVKKQESQSCATSSGDETGVWTPEHEPESKDNTPKNATTKEYIWKADSYVAPVMDEQKNWASSPVTTSPSLRRRLTRPELIQQQRQNYTPHAKARCSHWPCCTNKNCKFWHPFRDCREGETCPFGNKCMFIHPSDYLEPVRGNPTYMVSVTENDLGLVQAL